MTRRPQQMSRRRRGGKLASGEPAVGSAPAGAVWKLAVVVVLTALAGVGMWLAVRSGRSDLQAPVREITAEAPGQMPLVAMTRFGTLEQLLGASSQRLSDGDIAEWSLLCASGLPGAGGVDVDGVLSKLDDWARQVAAETRRQRPRFVADPAAFRNSEAYFRMLTLVTVLQRDLGVRYNAARVTEVDFKDSRDLFVHGLTGYGDGGTCVSMPVAYVAVGRRLGYPLKLALAKSHVFVRWDGQGERLNIEATNRGLTCLPDEYYTSWPAPLSQAERRGGWYLRSLAPAEELALLLQTRGHCLLDNGRADEAAEAYALAAGLAPRDPNGQAFAAHARRLAGEGQTARTRQRRPEPVRRDPLAEAARIEALNAANMRRWRNNVVQLPGPDPQPNHQP